MRKTLLASLMVVCLSGCSAHYGQIACETIEVVENDRMVFKDSHGEDFDRVNEFVSAAGDIIYTDYVPYSYLWRQGNNHPEKLKVYATKDSEEYVEYEFYSDIGPIGYTKNCYVDLKTHTVEVEIIYTDMALSYPQFREMEGAEEAYECAKKCYYHIEYSSIVYLDEIQKGLECHYFTTFGEEAEITYTELK